VPTMEGFERFNDRAKWGECAAGGVEMEEKREEGLVGLGITEQI